MFHTIATITVVMLVLDAVWLTATAPTSRAVFAKVQGKPLEIRWLATAAVYAVMVAALWFFAVEPATTWYDSGARGATLGAAMYGLYDLTNYATLSAYPLDFAVTDIAWGTTLFGLTAIAAKLY